MGTGLRGGARFEVPALRSISNVDQRCLNFYILDYLGSDPFPGAYIPTEPAK